MYDSKHKGLLYARSLTFQCECTYIYTYRNVRVMRSLSNSRINGTPVHTEATRERRKNFISDLHSAQRRVTKRGELRASNWKACKGA